MSDTRFSIIIPTRNRAARLAECLDFLAALEFERSGFEVMVVDNASRDRTGEVLAAEVQRGRFLLRPIRVERAGTSHARNAGVRNAAGEFILFLDDDARVVPGWLTAYERCFCARGCAVVQGRVMPRFVTGRPIWLTDQLAVLLGLVDEGETFGPLQGGFNGCNVGVSRQAFDSIGEFRTDLGPGGIGMAEDTEFGLRARAKGFMPAYAPDALAYHLIPRQRTTRAAMLRRYYQSGRSQPLFTAYDESLPRTLGYFARRSFGRLSRAVLAADSVRHMWELCTFAQHSGRVVQILRMRLRG